MKIDLYNLRGEVNFSRIVCPILIDTLKVWAESKGWEARTASCRETKVDLASDADVVGISVYTQAARAAYRASAELRKRGKIVFLGGPHFRGPSTLEEAAPYCDVIAPSICEDQWGGLLEAVADRTLRPNQEKPLCVTDSHDRFRYPENFYEPLRNRRWYQVPTIATSIGCPYDCGFCAAHMQGKYLLRGIETIYNETARVPGKIVFFCDPSFGLNKGFTLELMRALAPLEKKIAAETTLTRLRDAQLLKAMAEGGIRWMMVGIETMSLKLRKHGPADLGASVEELVARAHDVGILVQGNFICGLDSDDLGSFDRIYECCERSKLDAAHVNLLTPYPDTPLYLQLEREGRILDRNWDHYDGQHVVYQPRRMTVDQLIEGYVGLHRRLGRCRSILQEAAQNIGSHGIGAESIVMLGHGLYRRFDAIKKRRWLRQSQRSKRALDA